MKQEQLDLSNGTFGIDAKQNNVNSPLIKREAIDNTPFYLIHLEGKWFVVFGEHRITEMHEGEATPEQALAHLDEQRYWIQVRIAGITQDKVAAYAIEEIKNLENAKGKTVDQ